MHRYQHRANISAPASQVFAWHERPGAFEMLTPPWADVDVVESRGGIQDGGIVVLKLSAGPLNLRWKLQHSGFIEGQQFRDSQVSGPFESWEHTHSFSPAAQSAELCTIEDTIKYAVPLELPVAPQLIDFELDRMFRYRSEVLNHVLLKEHVQSMKILVSGSHGLIGRQVCPSLSTSGHDVKRLVRKGHADNNGAGGGTGVVSWDPASGAIDESSLDGLGAVVHLAGENIASGRWTPEKKEELRKSRVEATWRLCEALAKLKHPPKVLVCASAIGYYGDSGAAPVDEHGHMGDNFLAHLAKDWEEACAPARDAGIRVVNLRFGVVLSPRGGALGQMLLPFQMGAGGIIGSGKQYMSWIAIDDVAHIVSKVLFDDSISGAVNATAPHPVTNREFTKTLGKVLARPTICPVPAFGARLVFGEMADELLLSSCRALPAKLQERQFQFQFPTLESALRHVLGKQ